MTTKDNNKLAPFRATESKLDEIFLEIESYKQSTLNELQDLNHRFALALAKLDSLLK